MGNLLSSGVNFADGRIKGDGLEMPFGGSEKHLGIVCTWKHVMVDSFVDNGGSMINDVTVLCVMERMIELGTNLGDVLKRIPKFTVRLGYSDWRLPDAKELQYY